MAEEIEVTASSVTYTTKELLKRIDDRFDRMEAAYLQMPTRQEFDHAVARLAALEVEQVDVRAVARTLKEQKTETFTKMDKVVGIFLASVALLVQMYAVTGGFG